MIARRYGSKVQSVQINFDPLAISEIGFRRDHEWSEEADEFFEAWAKAESHEITAESEGEVQGEAESALLDSLREQLVAIHDRVGDDGVLLIESEQGVDYPKTRCTQTTQVVGVENRLYFRFTVDPPLRMAVYRKR